MHNENDENVLRAVLVSTSYRNRVSENFELNSIKLIDSHFARENIFHSSRKWFFFWEAQLKMLSLIRMRNCIELFVHASTLYYTATLMYHFMDWLSTCLEVSSLSKTFVLPTERSVKVNKVFNLRNWFFSKSRSQTFFILRRRSFLFGFIYGIRVRTAISNLRPLIQLFFCWKFSFNCTNEGTKIAN